MGIYPITARTLQLSGWWLPQRWSSWRERRFAHRRCRELMALYHRLTARRPDLRGERLYRALLTAHLDGDEQSADDLLHRAMISHALWPVERPLTLHDVVHCRIVAELAGRYASGSVQTELTPVINQHVPRDL